MISILKFTKGHNFRKQVERLTVLLGTSSDDGLYLNHVSQKYP